MTRLQNCDCENDDATESGRLTRADSERREGLSFETCEAVRWNRNQWSEFAFDSTIPQKPPD